MIAWSLFIPACFALNCAPGPNNMLALTNAARLGFLTAFLGGLGRMPAFAFLIFVTVMGLGAVIAASATAFLAVKILGAVYLVYVGVQVLIKAKVLADVQSTDTSVRELMRRDFTMAITNPKAIAIFTAFFPQFLTADGPVWQQLSEMGGAFLIMEVAAVALYVIAGALLRGVLRSRGVFVWLNRVVGSALIAAGGAMALSRG